MSTWKSVDRLDNAVLKSPDGNWIALQSAQLSRPSLLTKRKSLVYSALEKESGVVSAYERMGSDSETKPDPDSSWGAALQEIQRKMTDFNFNSQDSGDATPSTLMDSRDNVFSDLEGNWRPSKDLLALFRKKVYANEIRLPSSSRRASIIDVNFNMEGGEEESEAPAEQEEEKVRTLPKKRTSKKEPSSSSLLDYSKPDNHLSDAVTLDTLTSGVMTPESDITGHEGHQMDQELTLKLQQLAGRVSDSFTREEEEVVGVRYAGSEGWIDDERRGGKGRDEEDEKQWRMEVDVDDGKAKDEEDGRAEDEGRTEDEEEGRTEDEEKEEVDEEMEQRFYRLVAQSRLTYFSSTDDELENIGQSEGEWEEDEKDEDAEEENKEQNEESAEKLTYKLCQLEKEVRASQFSSTEDELDRVGVEDEERKNEDEELAVKVCRLASQINATQFSSTEDELDRAGSGGEEEMDEEALWKMQAEKAIHVAQLRDLSSLVSASQFSSTEDELDRVGEKEVAGEGGPESKMWEEAVGKTWERRESLGYLDVNMFDLRDENEQKESGETKDVQQDEKDVEEDKDGVEERSAEEREDDQMASRYIREGKALKGTEKAHEPEEKQETEEEMITTHETKVQQENRPEAKWPDRKEGEDRQEEGDIRGGKESQDKWETADSDEEDAEFNRIISSMLMLTLEDMQGGAFKDEDNTRPDRETAEVETDKNVKLKRGSGFEDSDVDAQSAKASQETGSAIKSQSRGNKLMLESTTGEGPGEYARQQTGGDDSREKESVDAAGRNDDRTKEQMNSAKQTIKDTLEAEQTRKQREVDADEQEDGGGTVTTERQTMETHAGDAADGGRDRKDETKDENAQEALLSPQEIQMRYSAVSLRSITTEVLKVLNATEELLQGVEGGGDTTPPSSTSLPPNTDPKKLDQQFSRLEENVYVAAGAVYSLEAELNDLEECARGICSATSDMELSFLEEQVASAAAKVQQSDLQICDISARIAALKSAGLDVDTQSRATKTRTIPVMPVTLDSSRQLRRRLPAPPVKEDKET